MNYKAYDVSSRANLVTEENAQDTSTSRDVDTSIRLMQRVPESRDEVQNELSNSAAPRKDSGAISIFGNKMCLIFFG